LNPRFHLALSCTHRRLFPNHRRSRLSRSRAANGPRWQPGRQRWQCELRGRRFFLWSTGHQVDPNVDITVDEAMAARHGRRGRRVVGCTAQSSRDGDHSILRWFGGHIMLFDNQLKLPPRPLDLLPGLDWFSSQLLDCR